MIELRSVRKVYVDSEGREQEALRGVDLKVESGEVHALIGTSGCGKTTTLRLVNRLEEPTSGQVLVITPDEQLHGMLGLPEVTNLAFGGPEGTTLYATTLNQVAVYSVELDIPGFPY